MEEYKLPNNYFQELDNETINNYLSSEEKIGYLKGWSNKLTSNFVPFSKEEYQLYYLISRENQYYNNIQDKHYIDDGCCCRLCSKKRFILLTKIKNGYDKLKKNDYIIHSNIINEFNSKKHFLVKKPKHQFFISNI
jgi:hypothetical protein